MTKLLSLNEHREQFKSDADAARALGIEYMTYRRWLQRKIFSPSNSAWRQVLAGRGVELPYRGAKRSR